MLYIDDSPYDSSTVSAVSIVILRIVVIVCKVVAEDIIYVSILIVVDTVVWNFALTCGSRWLVEERWNRC